MRTLLLALCLLLPLSPAQAQARLYSQPELDALLAPIALYPDPLLSQILTAAVYPDQVALAADWSRRNPGVSGDDAVQMVQGQPWDPNVKSLVAYPDVLARMADSPQWTSDLGNAFVGQQTELMNTVQALRQRAQASGYLRSNAEQNVVQQGQAIAVQPVYPQYVYVRYYDPLVVYGTWWWPAYRPVFWRPWAPRVVFVNHVNVVSRPVFVTRPRVWSRPWHNVPESQRSPIIQSSPRPQWRSENRHQWRSPVIQSTPRPQWRAEDRQQRRPVAVAEVRQRPEFRHERPATLTGQARSFQPRQQAQQNRHGGRRS